MALITEYVVLVPEDKFESAPLETQREKTPALHLALALTTSSSSPNYL